ncbi:MAG: hypothetical protein OD814_001607 [Candidatus Alkanophagales archaeon MCA70_species_1]|nr:hypothetical protein [Candidatus Alkanophaga volatiphilum]
MLHDVPDFEDEAVVERRVDDESRGVKRVGEHSEDRKVERPRLGFIHHECDQRLALTLREFHFGDSRTHAAYVTAEGVLKQVLTCAIKL